MASFDKAAPVYTGQDKTLRQIAEYENYLREQMAHEIELLKKRIEELEGK